VVEKEEVARAVAARAAAVTAVAVTRTRPSCPNEVIELHLEKPVRANSSLLREWLPPREGPCDEEAEYARRCSALHRHFSAHLANARHRRGLFIELEGTSTWGIGHALAFLYRIHDVCFHLGRYCYVRIYDMQLEELLGYANNRSYEPAPEELAQYAGEPSQYTVERDIDALFPLLEADDAPLIHVRYKGLMHRWNAMLHLGSLPWDAKALRDHFIWGRVADPHLSRCFCRFVTWPRFALSPKAPHVVYHLRSNFADLPSPVLAAAANVRLTAPLASGIEARSWFRVACPSLPFPLPPWAHVVSDAPGFARVADGGCANAGRPCPREEEEKPSTATETTRSWRSPLSAKVAALRDGMLVGRARVLVTSRLSSFGRPLVARSMCNAQVFDIRSNGSGCELFEALIPRDLVAALGSFRRRWRTDASAAAPKDSWESCWERKVRARLPGIHPCGGNTTMGQCQQRFLMATA